jgi:hypothetical protein
MILEQDGGEDQTWNAFKTRRWKFPAKLGVLPAGKGSFDCAAASHSRSCYSAQDDSKDMGSVAFVAGALPVNQLANR